MRRVLVVVSLVLLVCTGAMAQSAKSAVQVNTAAIVNADCAAGAWSEIAKVSIHTSSQKDLVIGASLETILYTDTLVKSKGGSSDTSTAEALLKVRVLADDTTEARPGVVIFDKRTQTLMAKFNGICTDLNGDGIVQYNECTQPEELQLILDTTAAHHFNFLLEDVGVGDHTVRMQGCVATSGSAQAGSWDADAAAGKGAITVEEVRLVKDQDVIYP